jgi:hypothetical protein
MTHIFIKLNRQMQIQIKQRDKNRKEYENNIKVSRLL